LSFHWKIVISQFNDFLLVPRHSVQRHFGEWRLTECRSKEWREEQQHLGKLKHGRMKSCIMTLSKMTSEEPKGMTIWRLLVGASTFSTTTFRRMTLSRMSILGRMESCIMTPSKMTAEELHAKEWQFEEWRLKEWHLKVWLMNNIPKNDYQMNGTSSNGI
jgi:hypothetical protein